MSLKRARWLLNLDKHAVNDILDTLVEAGPEGTLTAAQFTNAMLLLVRLGGNLDSRTSDYEEASSLLGRLFDAFDEDGVGVVNLSLLTSGLSTLCDVPMSEKISFAFTVYDQDGDGLVSLSELVDYMTSVFNVLFVTSTDIKGMLEPGVSMSQLATATATQAFSEAGLSPRSKLDQASFTTFVQRGIGFM